MKKYLSKVKHGTLYKGLRLWGRYARGDFLTPVGKSVFVLTAAGCLFVVDITAASDGATWSGFNVLAFCLLFGFWIAKWITFVPEGCPGPRHSYSSPKGHVRIGLCHGCENWGFSVRDKIVAQGDGKDSLVEALIESADKHHNASLHEEADELRQAADKISEFDDLHSPDLFGTPDELRGPDFPPELAEALKAQIPGLQVGPMVNMSDPANVPEPPPGMRGAVLVDAAEFAEFNQWRAGQGKDA